MEEMLAWGVTNHRTRKERLGFGKDRTVGVSHSSRLHQCRRISGIGLFVGLLLCSVTAGLVQRICWVAYRSRSVHRIEDVLVPLPAWVDYHTTTVGLVLDILIVSPLLVLVLCFWLGRPKTKRIPNQPDAPDPVVVPSFHAGRDRRVGQ